jgi:hypothetical protein
MSAIWGRAEVGELAVMSQFDPLRSNAGSRYCAAASPCLDSRQSAMLPLWPGAADAIIPFSSTVAGGSQPKPDSLRYPFTTGGRLRAPGEHMKALWIGVAALALVARPAISADMPTKAPLYKAPPLVWSWTGFYGGANVGYSWGNSSNDWNIFAANANGPTVWGMPRILLR